MSYWAERCSAVQT